MIENTQNSMSANITNRILLVIIKVKKQINNIVPVVCIANGVNKVFELVNHQTTDRHASGVIEFNGITRRDSFKEVEQWIYSSRIVRKK